MRHITAGNQKDWDARFTELKLEVEWGWRQLHPSFKVNGIEFTYESLNVNPEAAEALWDGEVELAQQFVSSRT